MPDVTCPNNPIVLVHGIWDSHRIFEPMQSQLEAQGFIVYSLDLTPSDGSVPLEVLAKQLDLFVQQTIGPTQFFDLIGFSMGGIVSRYYLQRLEGLNRVQRFISISSPHHGTLIAWFSNQPAVRQMRPYSQFLADLNQDIDQLKQIQCTTILTPFDFMIVPTWSSVIPVGNHYANTYLVPVLLHKCMVYDHRVFDTIVAALGTTANNHD